MVDYEGFLESKKVVARRAGIEVAASDVHPLLFPFQRDVVVWAVRKGQCAIFISTGLGKTFCQLEWSRLLGQNTLIIAPLSVARQTVREGTKIGLNVRYVRDGDQVTSGHNLWITNYELIDRFDFSVFGAVVCDECFVADTPVDTPVGLRPIQDIRPGDEVYTAVGIRKVRTIHTRYKNSLVLTSIQGRDIISSENHLYLTRRGWISAKNLREGDYIVYTKEAMRMVREATCRTSSKVERTFLQHVLLSEMENESRVLQDENIYARATSKDNSKNQIVVEVGQSYSNSKQRTNQTIESDIQSSDQREDIKETPRNGTQTLCAGRKWETTPTSTANALQCLGERLGNGICSEPGQNPSGISNLLQNRYCESSSQDSYRGGWIQSHGISETCSGREERIEVAGARVDRVTIYKSDDPIFSRYCDSTGRAVLYDLEVEGHPSFSVHGLLVHNSSIMKAIDGKTRKRLMALCEGIPYRLCCTATPAPNDYTEIGQHAEFLGVCTASEMIAMFFVNANKEHTFTYGNKMYHRKGQNKGGQEWRLKHHAEIPFFKWLSSWAITMMKPSDLGYDDDGFILPPLNIYTHFITADYQPQDKLMFTHLGGVKDRNRARASTVEGRLLKLKELVTGDDQWIIWTGLQAESTAVTQAFPGSVEVKGDDTPEYKAQAFEDFQDGKYQILVSKAKIAGFGMNFQNASHMAFMGLSDSWELYYQAIRREWRYRQEYPVDVHIIMSDIEAEVYQNVMRKDAMANRLREKLIEQIRTFEEIELERREAVTESYAEMTVKEENWTAMMGDSCKRLSEITENSVDLSCYSPPFADLFTYSDSERDLGNSKGWDQFFEHYAFIIREVLRVTKPGRLTCVHTSDIPAMASRDGYIGVRDFPGAVIRAYETEGWTFVGRAFVQKNPQCLKDGTPVLTPDEWKPIESIEPGMFVIGSDGKSTMVTDVPYQGVQPIYRVTFDDGAFIDCGPLHLWTVRTNRHNKWRPERTFDLFVNGTKAPSGNLRYEIPIALPTDGPIITLPMSPRLLGALLADGSWANQRCMSITKDKVLIESLPLPEGHTVTKRKNSDKANGRTATYGITGSKWHQNDVLSAMRELGLEECRAWEKFIPAQYLMASVENRRELLRGLLDGDGKIAKKGGIYYRTTSEQLADGVVSLVNSLGGLATSRCGKGGKYADTKEGRPLWTISIRLNGEWCPFTLERKARFWKPNRRAITRRIQSIEYTNDYVACTCISVAAENGLYVTDDYVVTHNSQAIRVKSKALLFVQMRKDSASSRPALVDQILLFRKPGENAVPITPVDNGEMDNERWIEWAHGIWLGISETDTLQYAPARGVGDEKHVCPLQLGTIERCVKLYSNPGETVLTCFGGIGSEAVVALKLKRKAILIELKPEYFMTALKNMREVDDKANTPDLFSISGITV